MNNYVDKIINVFTKNFSDTYKALHRKGKSKILRYLEPIYRRWYYASFIEETILSPANLIDKLTGTDTSITVPTLKSAAGKSFKEFECVFNSYSLDNHPVINDLKLFLQNSYPDISLTTDGCFSEDTADKLIDKLSISDPFYPEFLLQISLELKLVKKVPSIHSSVFHISDDYLSFFKLPIRKQLDGIVNAAVNSCYNNLSELLPINKKVFSKNSVLNYLKNPVAIDEIFAELYAGIGISVEDIWSMEADDLDEIDNIILSSTFVLGVMFDRWFLTPFGHYLKLIRPLYILPYKFDEELSYLCDELSRKNGDLLALMYAPCSHYGLTVIGSKYFNIPLTEENSHIITNNLPIERITNTVVYYAENGNPPENPLPAEQSINIFEVKVKILDDKRFWKVLEIQATKTLHDLHMEICKAFNLSFANNYSMFLGPGLNPFAEYVSPGKNTKSRKKTGKAVLQELNLTQNQKIIYTVDNTNPEFEILKGFLDNIKLELEIVDIKNGGTGVIYPRVTKISKLFKELEDEMTY